MREVINIQKYGDGYLVDGISDTGVKEQAMLIDIRCAIIPPKEEFPGYFLLMGMKKDSNIYGKYPLLFLHEGTATTQTELLDFMADHASRLKCSIVYCDVSATKQRSAQGFFKDVWKYRFLHNLPMRINQAVSSRDYEYGKAIVTEWFKDQALLRPIHETILDSQVKSDYGMVQDSDPSENRWYAFHALRFIIAGYIKNPPARIMQMSLSGGWGDKYDS